MKFRNYCIVVMGDTNNVVLEIEKVSEIKPHVLDAKGVLIATFSSMVEPNELRDFFKLNDRSFLLFDLNPKYSGYYINKKIIHETLFGFVKTMNDNDMQKRVDDIIKHITSSSDTKTNYSKPKNRTIPIKDKTITEADIDQMDKTEKKELLDKLLDKGAEKLTDYDKMLIQKLVL